MNRFTFKIPSSLVETIHVNFSTPHPFAYERIGFITVGFGVQTNGVVGVAQSYYPVKDEHYIPDEYIGAAYNDQAIRDITSLAYQLQTGIFHIHAHYGSKRLQFSEVDEESASSLIPSLFSYSPNALHGVLLVNEESISGRYWKSASDGPHTIDKIVSVGHPIRRYSS